MKTLYFDSTSGAAGDMILGALLDAGAPEAELRAQLAEIELGEYQLTIAKVKKNGLTATKLNVTAPQVHQHCHLPKILKMLANSKLAPAVKLKSQAIFENLARAEAKIHGITPEKVHFHEVGAVDSLVDIIGTVIALELLGVDQIYCSPLPVGSGFVECAHGTIPVPAPATLELLQGIPLKESSLTGELVTPTGAAILATLVTAWVPFPALTIQAIGYGAGTREMAVPNVLRAVIGTPAHSTGITPSSPSTGHIAPPLAGSFLSTLEQEDLLLLEANLDDMQPEFYPYLLARVLEQGALDASWQPLMMKKGRPGYLFTVLLTPDLLETISQTIFAETTTLGFRVHPVKRYKLPRSFVKVATAYGEINVKLGQDPQCGQFFNTAPEYEECRQAAQQHQVPLKTVYDAAKQAALELIKTSY